MALPLGVFPATGGARTADSGSLHTKSRHFTSGMVLNLNSKYDVNVAVMVSPQAFAN